MSANPYNGNYKAHLLGCAEIALEVAAKLGLRDGGTVQACFATVCIDAQKHGVFMEPTPPTTKTPASQPASVAPPVTPATQKDVVAAEKADAQIKDIDPNPTPEKAETANRGALLDGIEKARQLLIKEGYTPTLTPKALNEIIKSDMKIEGGLGVLDLEQLEFLTKKLSVTLDTFRANKKALDLEAPF